MHQLIMFAQFGALDSQRSSSSIGLIHLFCSRWSAAPAHANSELYWSPFSRLYSGNTRQLFSCARGRRPLMKAIKLNQLCTARPLSLPLVRLFESHEMIIIKTMLRKQAQKGTQCNWRSLRARAARWLLDLELPPVLAGEFRFCFR
jgi:hypothetical protein